MKDNLSIENLYSKLDKSIQLFNIKSKNGYAGEIIKSCGLLPEDSLRRKTHLYESWVDKYNCSLYIEKDKLKLKLNTFKEFHFNDHDLYSNLDKSNISKISKSLYMCYGEDDGCKYAIMSYLGLDNYFRTFILEGDEEYKASNLSIGLNNLMFILQNKNINMNTTFKNKNDLIPFNIEKEMVISLPAKEVYKNLIKTDTGINL